MANNRLWAVCKDDNDATVLCKYYPGTRGWGDFREDREFFEKHDRCTSNRGCGENIVFVTEIDDLRVAQYDFTQLGSQKIYLTDLNPSIT